MSEVSPSFKIYRSVSEVQSVLYYTDPFQKSSPSIRLYRSVSEVQSVF